MPKSWGPTAFWANPIRKRPCWSNCANIRDSRSRSEQTLSPIDFYHLFDPVERTFLPLPLAGERNFQVERTFLSFLANKERDFVIAAATPLPLMDSLFCLWRKRVGRGRCSSVEKSDGLGLSHLLSPRPNYPPVKRGKGFGTLSQHR